MLVAILICALLGGVFAAAAVVAGRLIAKKWGEPRGKKWAGVLGAVAAGLVAGLGPAIAKSSIGETLEVAIGLKHRSEVILKDALKPVLEHPTVRETLQGKSDAEAEAYTARLAHDGIVLLDDGRLAHWAELRTRMAQVSPRLCSALWKGGVTSSLVLGALDALPDAEVLQWGEISGRACLLAVDQHSPGPSSTTSLREGIAEVVAVLPPNEGQAFERDAQNPKLNDQRACELLKSLFDGAKRLAPARRIAFYRTLASVP